MWRGDPMGIGFVFAFVFSAREEGSCPEDDRCTAFDVVNGFLECSIGDVVI
jgi:hypothetical protein